MLPREQFEAEARRIGGLHTQRHARILEGLLHWLRPRHVLEIGAFHGGTTVWMGRALQELGEGTLRCIDNFSLGGGSPVKLAYNLGRCGLDNVHITDGTTADDRTWPDRVDFAYVDGDHSYRGCNLDVEKAIARGARCIVVHDVASWWGPRRWLAEIRRSQSWDVLSVGFDEGLAVILKRRKFPPETFSQAEYPEGCV